MKRYRSLETIEATQFDGSPIDGVTCSGSPEERQIHGCDPSRKDLLHVHTPAIGGLTVLKKGDWIMPKSGGPFVVASDELFRSHWDAETAIK